MAQQEFLMRAARLVSLSLKARHEGCIQQAERLAIMAAETLADASVANGGLGDADMTALTRKDVIETIGDVDDVTVADIIATGATAQEPAEAQAWVINDEALLNTGRPLPTGRVMNVAKSSGDQTAAVDIGQHGLSQQLHPSISATASCCNLFDSV